MFFMCRHAGPYADNPYAEMHHLQPLSVAPPSLPATRSLFATSTPPKMARAPHTSTQMSFNPGWELGFSPGFSTGIVET